MTAKFHHHHVAGEKVTIIKIFSSFVSDHLKCSLAPRSTIGSGHSLFVRPLNKRTKIK